MSLSVLSLPQRPRSYKFVLTPIADAMFQLLIFFMLSTSLTPYSLMTLRSAEDAPQESSGEAGEGSEQAQALPAPSNDTLVIWNLSEATINTGGQPYDIERAGELAEALSEGSVDKDVVILVSGTARVQDLASVMEALQTAAVASIRVVSGQTGQGG